MKRTKESKIKKSMSLRKKIAIIIVIFVVALGSVFAALLLTHERLAYSEAKDYASGILNTRELVENFFDTAPKNLEFSDDEARVISDFEASLEKNRTYMESLAASTALKDGAVEEKYLQAKEKYEYIERLARIWSDAKLLLDVTDENLAKLKESKSEVLSKLAEELIEYRMELSDFKAKYSDGSGDGLIEEYGKMQLIGDGLNKEFEAISLDELLGMSRDDIMTFYATIEELNNVLAERI